MFKFRCTITLSYHINSVPLLFDVVHDLVNFFNFLSWKIKEVFLDFNNIIDIVFGCLYIWTSILRRGERKKERSYLRIVILAFAFVEFGLFQDLLT